MYAATYDPCFRDRHAILGGLSRFEADLCVRLSVSVLLGAIIGYERKRSDRGVGTQNLDAARTVLHPRNRPLLQAKLVATLRPLPPNHVATLRRLVTVSPIASSCRHPNHGADVPRFGALRRWRFS